MGFPQICQNFQRYGYWGYFWYAVLWDFDWDHWRKFFFYKKKEPLPALYMFIIIIFWAMLGTFLATILKKYFFIVTTSYLGSFLIFRGFGSLFGNYPNVLIIKTKLPQSYYEYFGLIIGHTILG